jgi:hypothetical protein
MDFVIIFGPPAVGKMTVGAELQKLTGLKLFHNHMTIDLVLNFFEWGTPQFRLVSEFRRRIFEEVAGSDLPGLIFTYVWAFDRPEDKRYIDECCALFRTRGAKICFVELEASLDERILRNRSEFRLRGKPSKRDVSRSEELMLRHEKEYQLNSRGEFYYPADYLRIDNTHLSPEAVAQQIVERFSLGRDTV